MSETMPDGTSKFMFCLPVNIVSSPSKLVYLSIFHADNLKYGQRDAFGYNHFTRDSILEAASMNKSMYGDKIA